MGKTALSIGANTFSVFLPATPRGGAAKAISQKDVDEFLNLCRDCDITNILAHAPYTLNACAAKESVREFAFNTMADDLKRMEYVPGNMYNFPTLAAMSDRALKQASK